MTEALLPMPTLETERLILRAWEASDVQMVVGIFAEEQNARYIGGAKPEWQAWRHFAAMIGHWRWRGFTVFAVEEKNTGVSIGFAGPWYPFGWPEKEIGYSFIPEAQGKGYASEAALATLVYAYSELAWKTAISLIDKRNIASKRVAEKLGASFEKDSLLFGTDTAEVWRHLPPEQFLETHG